MATIADKLAQLNRPKKKIEIKSRDGEQVVEVNYQRPTMMQDRLLREAMTENYERAKRTFKVTKDGEESLYDGWRKQFMALGKEKVAQYIVGQDLNSIRVEAMKLADLEPLNPDANEEQEKAFMDALKPAWDEVVKTLEDEQVTRTLEELVDAALDAQIDTEARKVAFNTYRMELIKHSIFEDDGKPAFRSSDEIEEAMSPEAIDDLSSLIAEEVRKQRELPLNSAKTS